MKQKYLWINPRTCYSIDLDNYSIQSEKPAVLIIIYILYTNVFTLCDFPYNYGMMTYGGSCIAGTGGAAGGTSSYKNSKYVFYNVSIMSGANDPPFYA